jgi:hypothetical protein
MYAIVTANVLPRAISRLGFLFVNFPIYLVKGFWTRQHKARQAALFSETRNLATVQRTQSLAVPELSGKIDRNSQRQS